MVLTVYVFMEVLEYIPLTSQILKYMFAVQVPSLVFFVSVTRYHLEILVGLTKFRSVKLAKTNTCISIQ